MRRYIALWAELFRMSWRRVPGLTAGALAALAGQVVTVAATALTLRAVVNATSRGAVTAAVLSAIGAAVAYALMLVVQELTDSLILTASDQVGRLEVHPWVHRELATLDGLEHLERTDYLDRVTVVRKAGGRLVGGMWSALRSVSSLLRLVVTLLLLGSISPWLLLLLPAAAIPVVCDRRGLRAITHAELATAEPYRLQQHLFDLATRPASGKEIRVSGAASDIVRRQAAAWDSAMRRRLNAQVVAAAWKLAGWTLFTAAFIGGLVLVVHRTAQGHGTVGDLVLLVTVAATFRQTVQSAVDSTTTAAGAGQYIEPFLWLREYAAQHSAGRSPREPAPRLTRGIELENVSYTYPGTDRQALTNISVTLPAGSIVAIVGEYGSGKTTLVKMLCKFYGPDGGHILVDGENLDKIDTAAWRARSTAAFQDFGRFHTTLANTVGLGDLAHLEDRDRIADALREAAADDILEQLPAGLDTLLGRELGGTDLSEGQWQRSALARASMRTDPLLFILDEPTASLDAPSEQAIFQRYMKRARDLATRTGAITVIVSHRFSTVTGADLILVLEKGHLSERGTHAELMDIGGRYAELYGIQAHAYRAS
ncbi:ABC transporter [Streptomyces sp. ERV7]|uniref:ABC transporter ATP-binding protein n=1 Tax=Streptomyces sp. ERV7 TaxID=1322334 RepID=UPI0007F45A43|nr:ABC transporter ATP-binding protein [Streptomyces sp. ERV7]OAR26958.1 ABC transporter [Streptomyces sp. ERV7]